MALFKRHTVIERLARETGWLVNSREGDRYWLSANDNRRLQYVILRHGDNSRSVTFQSWLSVSFPLDNPPSGLFGRLLLRSFDLIYASWAMDISARCEATPCVSARLPATSLSPELFKNVCNEIVGEIASFRQELREKFRYDMGDPCRPPAAGPGVPVPRPGSGIRFVQ